MKHLIILVALIATVVIPMNAQAMTASASINLVVEPPEAPTITGNIPEQPTNGEYYVGEEIILTANGIGSSYQWYKDGVLLSETSDTLTIESANNVAQDNDSGSYTAVAVNSCNDESSVSEAFVVAVYDIVDPTITSNPESSIEGESEGFVSCTTITLTANVPGNVKPTLTYQWTLNGADIVGAESATYEIVSGTSEQSGQYGVNVTDGMGRDPMLP